MFKFEVYAGCDFCRGQRAIWTRFTDGREFWICDDCKKLEEAMRKNDAGTLMNKVSGLREEVEMMREKNAEQKMRIAELEKCINELRQILKDRDSAKAFTVPGTSCIIDFDCAKK